MLIQKHPFKGKKVTDIIKSINSTSITDQLANVPVTHALFKNLIPKMLTADLT